jgi:C-type mannose receptor
MRSWEDSEIACMALGANCHLASIHSSAENTIVKQLIAEKAWIGLHDKTTENTFINSDGTANDYTNWHSGEPNDAGMGEDCTEINYFSTGWNDNGCNDTLIASVCKCALTDNEYLYCPNCPKCPHVCQPGQYQDQKGQASCKNCMNGQYQDEEGQSSCKSDCKAGSYIALHKNACFACALGQYQDQDDQSNCFACGPGTFTKNATTLCQTCEAGKYQHHEIATEYQCKGCIAGQYAMNKTAASCKTCELGSVQIYSLAIRYQCIVCLAGKYYTNASTRCEICGCVKYKDQSPPLVVLGFSGLLGQCVGSTARAFVLSLATSRVALKTQSPALWTPFS